MDNTTLPDAIRMETEASISYTIAPPEGKQAVSRLRFPAAVPEPPVD